MSYSTNIRVLNYDPEGGADQPRSKVIDYMKSSENYVGARFIFECGMIHFAVFEKRPVIL